MMTLENWLRCRLALVLLVFISASLRPSDAQKDVVLRYSEAACDTLIPTTTEENYIAHNLGKFESDGNEDGDTPLADGNGDSKIFDKPTELTSRNPPFDIELDFFTYRSGKEYQIKIVDLKDGTYDSFILQVRGPRDKSGNVTYPGKWVEVPHIAQTIDCRKHRNAAVVNKGLPIRLSNLTFVWRAPETDVGTIKVVASIATGDLYQITNSREIRYENFPIPVSKCGESLGCFRQCRSEPNCAPDDTDLLVTVGLDDRSDPEYPEMEFKLGGRLASNKSDFVALGLGQSYYYLKSLDIVTCTRDGNQMELGHYFLEDNQSEMHKHRSDIQLVDSGIDPDSGLSWCSFKRPIRPETLLDLDLTKSLYQFYFKGKFHPENSSLVMPVTDDIQKSGFKFNITEPFIDVRYSASSACTSTWLTFILSVILVLM